ncbi:MAG TPA: DNA polymerase III subunit gamma and tau, partial [Tetrasphaera sp.]|nr:DNA polymerase III subunit gamma and tau [Tetrasphaera sp.]
HSSPGGSSQSARATQVGHGSGPGARGPASGANTGESSRPAPAGRGATELSTQHPAVDADIDDEDLISDDDEDLIALGEVGRPVIERVLGGTVIWSEGDES